MRLSLIKMRALGWSLLWARNRCRLVKTASLILLEQNRAMMVGCRLLSEAGYSLCETLISLADRSTCRSLETPNTSCFLTGQSLKLKAFTAAILLKVVNILLHLARLRLKLVDMIFKVLVLNVQCLYLHICRVKMFLHLLVLVGQELLAFSNLPHLFYQLDKGAAVLDKSFWHLDKFTIDVFDINFVAGASMLLSSIQGWHEQYYKSETNRSQPVQTDDGSRCFWIKNQYRTDRAVKSILSHFTIYNTLTQPLVNLFK